MKGCLPLLQPINLCTQQTEWMYHETKSKCNSPKTVMFNGKMSCLGQDSNPQILRMLNHCTYLLPCGVILCCFYVPPQQFLSSLDPPLDIPDEKILRWHPAFQLDMVPDIDEAELPKPPITGQQPLCVEPVHTPRPTKCGQPLD